ncbi:hypothetical protein glysoja_025328 [Glycine soja]|uniref:Transcription termination and cleavage factor C-terminal domain-containing protein n=1 Tax=Glycine soja TaxID=3848 RepID=A0A0B2SQI4_GLYSO|nr:hypothetical protein glysoja_025328 [Glycine soja]
MVSQNNQQSIQPNIQPAPLLPGLRGARDQAGVGNMPLGPEFGNQAGNATQVDRGSSLMPSPSDNLAHLSGPPGYVVSAQMGAANQPLRPPVLTPDMEKALLQQVTSLTLGQINLLSPEQRNQVLQLQQMLRQ